MELITDFMLYDIRTCSHFSRVVEKLTASDATGEEDVERFLML